MWKNTKIVNKRCEISKNTCVQKLKKLIVSDKKYPISSVFSQIMRIFASEITKE